MGIKLYEQNGVVLFLVSHLSSEVGSARLVLLYLCAHLLSHIVLGIIPQTQYCVFEVNPA